MPENNPEGYNFPQETGRTAGQRGSLKQVNATLLAQTDVLRDTQKSILSTNNLLTKSLQGQLKAASMERLKDLEKQREGGRFKAVAGGIGTAGSKVAGAAQSGLGSLQGMISKIGSFLTPAALMALPGILGGVLLKRGIPALAVGLFADEIADFLLGPEASKDLKDQVARGLQGGAIGSIFGKKFMLVGAAAGFLIDDEVAKQLLEVGKSFGNMIGIDIKNIEDLKGLMLRIGEFLRGGLKSGLEGINNLLNGNIKEFFGIDGKEGGGQVLATLGLIAGLGAVFAPKAALSGLFVATKLGLWTGGKVLGALRGIAGLGASIIAANATDMIPGGPDGPDGKNKKKSKFPGMKFQKGRGLIMAGASFLGPAGLLIAGTAVLGGFALSAVSDAIADKRAKDYEAAGIKDPYIPGVSDAPPSAFSYMDDFEMQPVQSVDPINRQGSRAPLSKEERLKLLEISRDGKAGIDRGMGSYLFGMSTEERIQAKQASIEAERMLRVLKRPDIPMAESTKTSPTVVDGSTNTVNNIGQTATTLSAPPPSAAQNDDYSGAVTSRMNLSQAGYLN